MDRADGNDADSGLVHGYRPRKGEAIACALSLELPARAEKPGQPSPTLSGSTIDNQHARQMAPDSPGNRLLVMPSKDPLLTISMCLPAAPDA